MLQFRANSVSGIRAPFASLSGSHTDSVRFQRTLNILDRQAISLTDIEHPSITAQTVSLPSVALRSMHMGRTGPSL